MSYTSFISYNTSPDEEVVVYRLQTLAGASDIRVLLPQRNDRLLTEETKRRINIADSVLVFLTSKLSPHVQQELAYAQAKEKLIIPIYEKGVSLQGAKSKYAWIEYDPTTDTPGSVEHQVLGLLKNVKKEKENRDAVLLAVLGIGLLALLASNK